jgi:hypothetical protein
MIGRLTWIAGMLVLAMLTAFLQIDRQSSLTPSLAPLVPSPLRSEAQVQIAAAAVSGDDSKRALQEASTLVMRRPVPAEHLTLLAVAQTKASQLEQAGVTIQIAGQRGWREPVSQEAVLRIALQAGDKAEAARRYAALFLRSATPDDLLRELGPAVLDETDGPGQRMLVDIISGTDRWNGNFLRRGVQVMPIAAFVDIAEATIERGTRYDCGVLEQAVKEAGRSDADASQRLREAALGQCPELKS